MDNGELNMSKFFVVRHGHNYCAEGMCAENPWALLEALVSNANAWEGVYVPSLGRRVYQGFPSYEGAAYCPETGQIFDVK